MKTQKKRRRETKTNYGKRLKTLKSGRPRALFRKTNRYILGQLITSYEAQDKVIIGISSKDLLNYGWPKDKSNSLKTLSAAYLTGMLLGVKMKEKKQLDAIFDIGMTRNVPKSKVYAFQKGLIDSGIELKTDKKNFPSEERIQGEHLKNKIDVSKIASSLKTKTEGVKKK